MTRTCASLAEPIQETHQISGVNAGSSPAAAIAALVKSQHIDVDLSDKTLSRATSGENDLLPSSLPDVRAFVTGLEFGGHMAHRCDLDADRSTSRTTRGFLSGYIVSGSEDGKLRLWDLSQVQRTLLLSGLESEVGTEHPSYQTFAAGARSNHVETWPVSTCSNTQSNRPLQRISLITNSQQKLLRSHREVITALVCVNSPFRGGIISGDRAGVLKVWRVEQFE